MTSRYSKDFIIYKNNYRHLTEEEFEYLNSKATILKNNKFLPGCNNEALHMYKRKITSEFTQEMRRSIRVTIDTWSR